jgi:deoxyadenosine/deoxycytidine kinase
MNTTKTLIVAVEGCIGAGKTTFIEKSIAVLKKHFNKDAFKFIVNDENININVLDLFLTSPSDIKNPYAFTLQMLCLQSRMEDVRYLRSTSNTETEERRIFLLDRSILGDIAFKMMHTLTGNMDEKEARAYDLTLENYPKKKECFPDVVIYLHVTTDVCLERINKRSRKGENDYYTIEYLDNLNASYMKILKGPSYIQNTMVVHIYDWQDNWIGQDKTTTDEDLENLLINIYRNMVIID